MTQPAPVGHTKRLCPAVPVLDFENNIDFERPWEPDFGPEKTAFAKHYLNTRFFAPKHQNQFSTKNNIQVATYDKSKK